MTKKSKSMPVALGLAMLVLVSGCGGFSGAPSVSPASFFLPGVVGGPALKPAGPLSSAPLLAQDAGAVQR